MEFHINNYDIARIHFRKDNGKPVYPERFWKHHGYPCRFTLQQGRDSFSWRGVPGELYHAYAPLHSDCWGDDIRETFAHWRLAIFAPWDLEHTHRDTPIIFGFPGIGDDYHKNELYIPTVVHELGCIFVAFDPHMTGERIFGQHDFDPLKKYGKNIRVLREKGYELDNDSFREMNEELAFNVLQITSMICERFGLSKMPPCITLGFSLGGFFAHQIAMQTPHCFGCVGGGAAPDIRLYKGPFGIGRIVGKFGFLRDTCAPPILKRLHCEDFHPLLKGLGAISRTPFPDTPVQEHVECHFIAGTGDIHFFAGEVASYCKRLPYHVELHHVKGEGHTPCYEHYQFNGVGSGMMQQLSRLVHKWRQYQQ